MKLKQPTEKIDLIGIIRRVTIVIYFMVVVCFAIIGLYNRFKLLKNETEVIRKNYTINQKQIIKSQVQSAVQFIQLARKSGVSKDDILESVRGIRFGSDRDGYVFVNTYEGIPLLLDAKIVLNGKSIWDLNDPNGVKVIQEERRACRNPDGDFIYYSWLKLSTNAVSPKVSFIKGIPEWKWMVGAGVYLDSLEIEINALQKQIITDTWIQALLYLSIILFLLFIIQLVFQRFTKTVEDEINLFTGYFDSAAANIAEIDISNIRYSEFSHIADDMNQMVNSKLEADIRIFSSEQRFRLQREQSPLGYVEYDLDFKIIYWNPAAEKIFGYSKEEILGGGLDLLLPSEIFPRISNIFKELVKGTDSNNIGSKIIYDNITKSGRRITCEWYNKALTDKFGEVLSIIALVDDITERKLMEDQLSRSLEEKQVLLKEVHHRVKNNMAIISSFISLQSMNIKDKAVYSMLQSTENRIRSMALIHEYLYRSDNLKDVNVKRYIDELVTILLASYEYKANEIATNIEIVQVDLALDLLIPLGMIINEIISNALKHAFKSIDSPLLSISLVKSKSENLILTIADNGIGLPERSEINESDSIGFVLINSLVEQIQGELEISRVQGTEYKISVSLK